jgi:hypothetical protein
MSQAGGALQSAERAFAKAAAALDELTANIRKAEERVAAVGRQVAEMGRDVDAHRRILGDRLVDEQFFAKGHEVLNLASPLDT